MITLKEYINEMAVAKAGDYDFGDLNYIGNKSRVVSKRLVEELLTFTKDEEKLFVVKYKSKTREGTYYFLTREIPDEENEITGLNKIRYQVICAMLLKFTTRYRGLGYGELRIVRGVETHSSERGYGYGRMLYQKMVDDLGFVLMGDEEQYEGARNLWVSLSKHPGFKVDIVDLVNGKIFEKNVDLKDALDPRIWTDEKLMLTGTKEERKIGRFRRLILTRVE